MGNAGARKAERSQQLDDEPEIAGYPDKKKKGKGKGKETLFTLGSHRG